jgi:hypothetical protein
MTSRLGVVLAATVLVGALACARDSQPTARPLELAPSERSGLPADASQSRGVLDPDQWADPLIQRAYRAARQYAHVLERLYCYCRCKENLGHRALIECFESDHGSMCDVCITEALIAARMAGEGRTPEEIQKAIDSYYGAG